MKAVTHLEKVITGEASAVTHLEKVIAQETSAVTYTEKAIAGTAPPITHLQKVIAGEAKPVTHLEYVWAGGSPPSEQEYTGAVPVTFIADGTPLLDLLISGNEEHSGTPTPDSPIMPEGTGERTGNLFDGNYTVAVMSVSGNTTTLNTASSGRTAIVKCEPNTTYTVKKYSASNRFIIAESDIKPVNGTAMSIIQNNSSISEYTFTTSNTTQYVAIYCSTSSEQAEPQLMLNSGSTPLPYEKYGYKIPISSANATTPIYLGEVQTTRKIKKLVLSSSQNWKLQSINSHGIANFYITITNDFLNISSVISNYFTQQIRAIADTTTEGMLIALSTNTATVYIRVKSQTASTEQEFKDWLDGLSEEAAIWYILATEETAVVNEPLMKIGDYADTLSMEQAGVEIPTVSGSNTLDVDTTVKPSEVYIKYKGEPVAGSQTSLQSSTYAPAEVSGQSENVDDIKEEETE